MNGDYVEMSATYFITSFERRRNDKEIWWNEDRLLRHYVYDEDGIVDSARKSQKFYFGTERFLPDIDALSQTAKTFFSNGIDIMPFPDCWFEWDHSCPDYGNYDDYPKITKWIDHHSKTVCLLQKVPDGITCQQFGGGLGCDRESVLSDWWFSGWVMLLDQDGVISWEPRTLFPHPTTAAFFPQGPAWMGPSPSDFSAMDRCLSLMAMLLARETKTVERRPPAGLNAHRVKKGKVPLFSHHVVTIDPQRIIYEGGDGGHPGGPKRTSPRLHWRRGHVRTLSSGKKIGIPPSIIGAKNGGGPVIDKTYRVRAKQGEEQRC